MDLSRGELVYNTVKFYHPGTQFVYPAWLLFRYYAQSSGVIRLQYNRFEVDIQSAVFEQNFKKLEIKTPIWFSIVGYFLPPTRKDGSGDAMQIHGDLKAMYDQARQQSSLCTLNDLHPRVDRINISSGLTTVTPVQDRNFSMPSEFVTVMLPEEIDVDPDVELKRRLNDNLRSMFI